MNGDDGNSFCEVRAGSVMNLLDSKSVKFNAIDTIIFGVEEQDFVQNDSYSLAVKPNEWLIPDICGDYNLQIGVVYDGASSHKTCYSGGITGSAEAVAGSLGIESCTEWEEGAGFYVFHVLVSNEDPNL